MNNEHLAEQLWRDVAPVVDIAVQLGLVPAVVAACDPYSAAHMAISRLLIHNPMQRQLLRAMYYQSRVFIPWYEQLATPYVRRAPSRSTTRRIRQQTQHSLPGSQATTSGPSGPSPVTPREQEPVNGQSRVPPKPEVRVRTEKQVARIKRKFKKMREKRKAKKQRLANKPGPTSDSEAANQS